MRLRDLISDHYATIDAVASYLDGLSLDARLDETRTLDRASQRKLYEKAASSGPIGLDHFVPEGTSPRAPVIHHGRNTLPLPSGLKLFEKRFCRPEDGSKRLFGYNESPFLSTIGPGFFVALPTAGRPNWESRGAVVIDYFQVPDGPVAAGWPEVVPNTKGLQRFVYHGTRDFMRKVSAHVSIGAAYKGEKPLDHYFILCRER
ncbi:hypothetical protein [Polyangium aurulentum]|uniref:hypothetical protein n=1 Tax=Polyangium aurulentum TaxID=2567896 RepID=UPI0010ADE4CD|nr:hypothetical protein [Polyangium aurulentum]UQA61625.1 hypothetical protein E8A73_014600 [Polyangium aurulentum]